MKPTLNKTDIHILQSLTNMIESGKDYVTFKELQLNTRIDLSTIRYKINKFVKLGLVKTSKKTMRINAFMSNHAKRDITIIQLVEASGNDPD